MGKFTIEIDTGNDAFSDNMELELARILGLVCHRLESGVVEQSLKDYNGNTVGKATYKSNLDDEGE